MPVWSILPARPPSWLVVHVASALGLCALATAVLDAEWHINATLHTVFEAVATVLALMVGSAAIVRYSTRREGLFLFTGVAFLGAGLLDGYHAVVTSAELVGWMPSHADNLIPWSWGASRLYLAAILMIGLLSMRPNTIVANTRFGPGPTFAIAGTALVLCVGLFTLAPLPPAQHGDLPIPRPQELIPAAMFGVCMVIYFRSGAPYFQDSANWTILSLIAGLFCQALFMANSREVFDAPFTVAHLLKLASYVFLEIGLLASMREVFRLAEVSRQDLLEANADLERYIHIASHDLKGPLRNIDDLAKWTLQDAGPEASPDTRSNLERIRKRTGRLDRLLGDLLTYSRIGRRTEMPLVVDSEKLVREAFAATNADGTFELAVASRLPKVGSASGMLESVIDAVMANAIRHNPRGSGQVQVSAEDVGAGMVRFSISDDGPGIPTVFRNRVFDLFQTMQPKDSVEGSGMGLTIARKAVQRVGGKIWLEPGLRRAASGTPGTTVLFEWPRSGLRPNQRVPGPDASRDQETVE